MKHLISWKEANEIMPENLLKKIEQLRQKLHQVAYIKGISHPEVLVVSKKLDAVILQYQLICIGRDVENNEVSV